MHLGFIKETIQIKGDKILINNYYNSNLLNLVYLKYFNYYIAVLENKQITEI